MCPSSKKPATGRTVYLEEKQTITGVSRHLDMSDRNARDVLKRLGLDYSIHTLDVIRVAYIRDIRGKAAGRSGNGDLDLAEERARLTRANTEKVEMENAQKKAVLVPVDLLRDAIADVGRQATSILEALNPKLKRRFPDLTAEQINLVMGEINEARNLVAKIQLSEEFLEKHEE